MGDPCSSFGVYDASASSTYKSVGTEFNATYGDGTNSYGPYVTDKLTLGDVEVDDFQFGMAESSTITRESPTGPPRNACMLTFGFFASDRRYRRCSL
jgi:hypothetical protein